MSPIRVLIGRTVYHKLSGLKGTVTAMERFNYNLCKRFTIHWVDGTVTQEIAVNLRSSPPTVKS